jgi:prophage regulatory protein
LVFFINWKKVGMNLPNEIAAVNVQPIHVTQLTDALLKCATVQAQTGLSRSKLYALIREGRFPAPLRLGPRCVRWHSASVRDWIASLAK